MEISPVADYYGELKSKFGIPRQSGIVQALEGRIVLRPEYRTVDALRGIEGFSHLWLIWEFSANKRHKDESAQADKTFVATVRPPRLGGNTSIGVFASRSPYRPNRLGLSCVKLVKVDNDNPSGPTLIVSGADLMDGTPIYDIKPYVPYADCHPDATGGFTDSTSWQTLEVVVPESARILLGDDYDAIVALLAQDPRPSYQEVPTRIYGMTFGSKDVHFSVENGVLTVTDVTFL